MTHYLDHASATPPHPAARAAWLAAIDDGWADPERLHEPGRRARLLLDGARETVAGVLGTRPDEVSFTGGGGEAARLALAGTLAARRRTGRRLLVSAVEHSSVLHAADEHAAAGGEVTRVAVDRRGRVDPAAYDPPPDTALASLQSGNQEVGTLQPVRAVADRCRRTGVPLHVDATQSVGRVPVDVGALGAGLLTAGAHAFGGPPRVGVLVVRTGVRWRPPHPAGGREGGRVAGLPDVPAVVAAAAALAARSVEIAVEAPRLRQYVATVRRELPRLVPDVEVVGDPDPAGRLPHIVSFSCLYVDGEALLGELGRAGIAVDSGSACTADSLEPSHVLTAMGALTHGNVRVSFGRDSTTADVERLLAVLPGAVERLRTAAGTAGL